MIPRRWLSVLALLVALAGGGALIFWRLTDKSLFLDEAFSLSLARLPAPQLLQAAAHRDVHPPLFYLFARAAFVWLHWPDPEYRWLTAPFGLLTIAATWGIVRRSFGDVAAAFAALFAASTPALVDFDRIFRMYAPLAAAATGSWWLLCAASQARGARAKIAWAAYVLSAIALPYIQYLGWFVVFSQALYALTRRPMLRPALLGAAAAVVAFVPWAWALRLQYAAGGRVAMGRGVGFDLLGVVRGALTDNGLPLAWLHGGWLDVAFIVAAAAILAGAVWLGRTTVLPFWLLPIALQLIASFAAGKNLLVPRYFVYLLPAFAASFGVVTAGLLRTPARLAAAAIAAGWLFVNCASLANVLLVPAYQTPDWYAVDLLLAEKERPDDVFVFDQGMSLLVMRGYATVRGHRAYAIDDPRQLPDVERWLERFSGRRVWYVENQAFNVDPDSTVLKSLHDSRPQLGAWLQPHEAAEDVVYLALFGSRRR